MFKIINITDVVTHPLKSTDKDVIYAEITGHSEVKQTHPGYQQSVLDARDDLTRDTKRFYSRDIQQSEIDPNHDFCCIMHQSWLEIDNSGDEDASMRVYLNIEPASRADAFKAIARSLKKENIPFEMKIPRGPDDKLSSREDNVVILIEEVLLKKSLRLLVNTIDPAQTNEIKNPFVSKPFWNIGYAPNIVTRPKAGVVMNQSFNDLISNIVAEFNRQYPRATVSKRTIGTFLKDNEPRLLSKIIYWIFTNKLAGQVRETLIKYLESDDVTDHELVKYTKAKQALADTETKTLTIDSLREIQQNIGIIKYYAKNNLISLDQYTTGYEQSSGITSKTERLVSFIKSTYREPLKEYHLGGLADFLTAVKALYSSVREKNVIGTISHILSTTVLPLPRAMSKLEPGSKGVFLSHYKNNFLWDYKLPLALFANHVEHWGDLGLAYLLSTLFLLPATYLMFNRSNPSGLKAHEYLHLHQDEILHRLKSIIDLDGFKWSYISHMEPLVFNCNAEMLSSPEYLEFFQNILIDIYFFHLERKVLQGHVGKDQNPAFAKQSLEELKIRANEHVRNQANQFVEEYNKASSDKPIKRFKMSF